MSKWIKCPYCGEPKEVPAYEGDGVYSKHHCEEIDQPEEKNAAA